MRTWWSRFKGWLTGRERLSAELAEEMEAHMALEADDRGEPLAEARRRFGNPARVAEEARAEWGFPSLDTLLQDTRYALRAMRRAPALTAVVVATLALGIGVNTAIFSVLHAVVLKPLPYPAADRLVWLGENRGISVTWVNFQNWLRANHTWEHMAAFQWESHTLTDQGEATRTRGLAVTSQYFQILGLKPLFGRLWTESDDRPGPSRQVVLSHRFWSERLGGDPGITGKTIRLDGELYEVSGVASPLWTPGKEDYYLSLGARMGGTTDRAKHGSIRALGRLKPGVTLAEGRADLDMILKRLAEDDPGPENAHHSYVVYYAETTFGEIRGTLMTLMGAALLVLLIACANVASLLLARNTARSGELAVRTAIGAGRMRLTRQLLTENLVLSACGGLSGVVLAMWCLRLLVTAAPEGIPRLAEVRLDGSALTFACALTLAAGLAAGLAPVLSVGRVDLTSALKDSVRSSGGRRRQAMRSVLVVVEIALTLVLAFGSGLLLRSLAAARNANPGYDPGHVLSLQLSLPDGAYRSDEARAHFYDTLLAELRAVPGVRAVGAAHCPPGAGDCGDWFYSIPGRPAPARNEVPIALFNAATPEYFETLRVPLRAGRTISARDVAGGAKVAVVNERFARRWWPQGGAVGRQIKVGGPYMNGDVIEIAGVVGDLRQYGLDSEPMEEIFLPSAQQPAGSMAVMLRTDGEPGALAATVRARVLQLDRSLPVQQLMTMEQSLRDGLARRRFITWLLGLFAALAMILAAVGIYGLLNYWVSVREAEIAIRLALGATPAGIASWMGGHALRLAALGVTLGALGGWLAAEVLRDMVFSVPARNGATLGWAGLAVAVVAAAATALPAWRASRVDAARRLHCA